ncbi:MAG TPA: hypothetical protein VJA25_10975 [Dehalococcoidia bacterium]|nr:hypothetical protein [Dehalococcoidia bacterium]
MARKPTGSGASAAGAARRSTAASLKRSPKSGKRPTTKGQKSLSPELVLVVLQNALWLAHEHLGGALVTRPNGHPVVAFPNLDFCYICGNLTLKDVDHLCPNASPATSRPEGWEVVPVVSKVQPVSAGD